MARRPWRWTRKLSLPPLVAVEQGVAGLVASVQTRAVVADLVGPRLDVVAPVLSGESACVSGVEEETVHAEVGVGVVG